LTIDHCDGRLADQRDVTVQIGEPVKEMLARRIGSFVCAAIAGEIFAGDVSRCSGTEVRPGAKSPPDPGQHDHPDIGIVVAGTHVFADLRHSAVFLRGAD
jgi:hypothetical protein